LGIKGPVFSSLSFLHFRARCAQTVPTPSRLVSSAPRRGRRRNPAATCFDYQTGPGATGLSGLVMVSGIVAMRAERAISGTRERNL
jgi:hypothetical protein